MTPEIVTTFIGYGITFVSGLGLGAVAEMLRFKYQRKKDNWKDLKSPLQEIYAVVRNMHNDSDHAFKIQDNGSRSAVDAVFERIDKDLEIYLNWFKPFEAKLGVAKVNSLDEELGAALKGISYYAIYSCQNRRYVETKLFRFREITSSAERRLQEFSKAKIPHHMIFGKRKLENWRTSQF
jgi:hypothetical protein